MFPAQPTIRADLTAGTLYAVSGEDGWIYYGQVTPEKNIGFMRRRDRTLADAAPILAAAVMAIVTVAYPSITRALRTGRWQKLGRFPCAEALRAPRPSVQWPVGTSTVTVFRAGAPDRVTRADDSSIQDVEVSAVWDAQEHIPARLTAEFGAEARAWHVGGSVFRERQFREECARRFEGRAEHVLPADWVSTGVR